MRVEKFITLPSVGVLKVVAYYNCTNELLYSTAVDNTGEYFEPSEKQIQFINDKLNSHDEDIQDEDRGN
jgi:hypothetical protein